MNKKHSHMQQDSMPWSIGMMLPTMKITSMKSWFIARSREGALKKRQVQHLFTAYAKAAGISGRSVYALRHSIAVHLLEVGRGIEYVADHPGVRTHLLKSPLL